MKRSVSRDGDDRDRDEPSSKRRSGYRTEMRLLVPSKNAGAVIGKGGSTIKRLRQDFHATIILPDTNTPERLMIISGTLDTICDVLMEILPILEERRDMEESEIRFLVHQSQAGAIIGRGGARVKDLREETGAHIKVYTECAPMSSERVAQVNGTHPVIVRAVRAILEIIDASPIKGSNRQYDPCNWDENFIHDYGGFSGRGDSSMPRGPPPGRSRMGGRGGYDDRRGYREDSYERDRRDRDRDRDRDRRRGGSYERYDRGGGYREQVTTSQVSVPKDLAGLIIGRNGSRIKEIRQQSGATITIDDPLEGHADRIITIIGSDDQIHTAQYLLQTTVKQHVGGR
jgi:heterogeneous nuclear ribonucleoprotein K